MRQNGILEDLSAEIGFTATTALVAWFGGNWLSVPAQAAEDHPIARVIGYRAMCRLVAAFGNETIWICHNTAAEVDRRTREVAVLHAQGMGADSIAAATGLSRRRVEQLRRWVERAGLIPFILREPGIARGKIALKNARGKRPR